MPGREKGEEGWWLRVTKEKKVEEKQSNIGRE